MLDRLRSRAVQNLTAGEWQRQPYDIKRRQELLEEGELVEDTVGGIGEIHWAPLSPRSTRELPNAPGWWATRLRTYPQWTIVEVIMDKDRQLWWGEGPHEPTHQVVVEPGRYWSDRPYRLPR